MPRRDPQSSRLAEVATPSGVRVSELRVPPGKSVSVDAGSATICLVCINGAGTLDERGGTFLIRRSFMAVRLGAWRGNVSSSPEAVRLVRFAWPERALLALGPLARGLVTPRTLQGRSSVELAWRAAGELRVDDPYTPYALEFYANGVALGLSRQALYVGRVAPARAARARRWLERELASPLDLRALASVAGCTPAYLGRFFRRTFGLSPREYQLRRRIERARGRLANSLCSMEELAGELGFHDSSHFARHFRRLTGMSPTEFRARHRDVDSVPKPSSPYRTRGASGS